MYTLLIVAALMAGCLKSDDVSGLEPYYEALQDYYCDPDNLTAVDCGVGEDPTDEELADCYALHPVPGTGSGTWCLAPDKTRADVQACVDAIEDDGQAYEDGERSQCMTGDSISDESGPCADLAVPCPVDTAIDFEYPNPGDLLDQG